jgi:uncharacterized Ntn-hydrolase superfamily protein
LDAVLEEEVALAAGASVVDLRVDLAEDSVAEVSPVADQAEAGKKSRYTVKKKPRFW